jgi:hypothetical protein
MRMTEEPFLTRDAVLSILRPGERTSERPFRTLRERGAASPGFSVPIRDPRGQVAGRVQLYSSLNGDAARAFRLRDVDLAQALAARAGEIERSEPARRVRDAVAEVASRMPDDPDSGAAPVALRRYLALRRHSTWDGLDRRSLAREWLAHSAAWLDETDEREELIDAIVQLDRAACEARDDLIADRMPSVTTFFGVVRRMDRMAAEVEGEHESLLIPRDDLERHGLAVLDQPVSLLRETLPGGGAYVLPMPAVSLEAPAEDLAASPWAEPGPAVMALEDVDWLERELAREPTAVPLAPLRLL